MPWGRLDWAWAALVHRDSTPIAPACLSVRLCRNHAPFHHHVDRTRNTHSYFLAIFSRYPTRCAQHLSYIHCNILFHDNPSDVAKMVVDRVLPERKNPLLEPTDSTASTYTSRIASLPISSI